MTVQQTKEAQGPQKGTWSISPEQRAHVFATALETNSYRVFKFGRTNVAIARTKEGFELQYVRVTRWEEVRTGTAKYNSQGTFLEASELEVTDVRESADGGPKNMLGDLHVANENYCNHYVRAIADKLGIELNSAQK